MKKTVLTLLAFIMLSFSIACYANMTTIPRMSKSEFSKLTTFKVIATGLNWMIIEVDGVEYLIEC